MFLDHGLLTVDQIDMFLKALPFEVTYADDNNQFLYYNFNKPASKCWLHYCHLQSEVTVWNRSPTTYLRKCGIPHCELTCRKRGLLPIVPGTLHRKSSALHNFHQAMYYHSGSYAGINEIVFDFEPWLGGYKQRKPNVYSAQIGQLLLGWLTQQAIASNSGHSAQLQQPR